MQHNWFKHYRPFDQRAKSVHEKARTILSLLADSPERLTALRIGSQTDFLEQKTRNYLGLLEYEGMVDKTKGTAGPHRCHRRICGCYGWGITELGTKWLKQK